MHQHDSDPDLMSGLGRRDFPSASAFGLYLLLVNDCSKDLLAFNVAAPKREYNVLLPAPLFGKAYPFSGIPWTKLTQSPLTQDAYTLESFYDLLSQSDTRYIVLPKEDFVNLITEPGKVEEIEKIDKGRQEREDEEERDG
jgi:hypothetical protein